MHNGNMFEFALRRLYPPQAGDVFKVYPGCNTRQTPVKTNSDNVVHFRDSYIPHGWFRRSVWKWI